jgi:hypothetical protein
MTIGPLEAQLIASSVIAIPGIAIVLYAVFTGHFSRKSEVAKYAVFIEEETVDYWEGDQSRRKVARREGSER